MSREGLLDLGHGKYTILFVVILSTVEVAQPEWITDLLCSLISLLSFYALYVSIVFSNTQLCGSTPKTNLRTSNNVLIWTCKCTAQINHGVIAAFDEK